MVRAPLIRLVSAWSGTGETPVPGVCVYVRLSVPDLLYEPNTPDMLKTALKNIETLKWIIQVRESCSTHPSHRQSEAPVDKSRHSMLFVKTPSYCNYHDNGALYAHRLRALSRYHLGSRQLPARDSDPGECGDQSKD